MIEKEVLLNDIQTNAQGSNFYEFQQQIQVCSIEILGELIRFCIFISIELSGK